MGFQYPECYEYPGVRIANTNQWIMKTIQLFISFSLAVLSILHGQENQLVLTNRKTHRVRVLESGEMVRIKKDENIRAKGFLTIIDSAAIAIGKDTIPLSEIIRVDAKTVDSRSTGAVLIVLGTGVLAFGIGAFEYLEPSSSSDDDSAVGAIAGICILGGGMVSGGIKKLIVGQGYKSKNWEYTIR